MTYIGHYQSPLGDILIATDEIGVYGLWFENQKYYASGLKEPYEEKDTELILKDGLISILRKNSYLLIFLFIS